MTERKAHNAQFIHNVRTYTLSTKMYFSDQYYSLFFSSGLQEPQHLSSFRQFKIFIVTILI